MNFQNTIKVVAPICSTHTASVIFFHGSGDTGSNLFNWVRYILGRNLEFSHIKMIYPTAPLQPYTPAGGLLNVWFDRRSVNIAALESKKSLANAYEIVNELINKEVELGIPLNRIMVGGFSMGGALALQTAFHLRTDLAGTFVCSSFLNRESIVYESLIARKSNCLPELLMFHGERDTVVPLEWGKETFEELVRLGVNGCFKHLENTLHEMKCQELVEIEKFILKKLPLLKIDCNNKL